MKLYYIQDNRNVVGNCALFWAKDAKGYTCNLDEAHVYTEEEVKAKRWRETDIPRDKETVDAMAIRHARRDHLRDLAVASWAPPPEAADAVR